jgi:hypothetical protein
MTIKYLPHHDRIRQGIKRIFPTATEAQVYAEAQRITTKLFIMNMHRVSVGANKRGSAPGMESLDGIFGAGQKFFLAIQKGKGDEVEALHRAGLDRTRMLLTLREWGDGIEAAKKWLKKNPRPPRGRGRPLAADADALRPTVQRAFDNLSGKRAARGFSDFFAEILAAIESKTGKRYDKRKQIIVDGGK